MKRKKLTLGQVRFLMAVSAALSLLLLPVAFALDSAVLMYTALGCFLLAGLAWFAFYKCPHCKKRIGRSTGLRCPYCGQKL